MDTANVEAFGQTIAQAFLHESAEEFQTLLLKEDTYVSFFQSMYGSDLDQTQISASVQELTDSAQAMFERIIQKGKHKGVSWNEMEYEGMLYHSDETMVGM